MSLWLLLLLQDRRVMFLCAPSLTAMWVSFSFTRAQVP
jgi:hypothetical protein